MFSFITPKPTPRPFIGDGDGEFMMANCAMDPDDGKL
jgi:hypothetical protein